MSGRYKAFQSHADAYTSFAAQVEDILRDEINTYISVVVREKKKEQTDIQTEMKKEIS